MTLIDLGVDGPYGWRLWTRCLCMALIDLWVDGPYGWLFWERFRCMTLIDLEGVGKALVEPYKSVMSWLAFGLRAPITSGLKTGLIWIKKRSILTSWGFAFSGYQARKLILSCDILTGYWALER